MTVVAGFATKAVKKRATSRPSPPRRSAPAGAAPAAPRPAEAAPPAGATAPADPAPTPTPADVDGKGGGGSAGPFVLGVVAYAWVLLPLVQGGPSRVRDVWRAKWLNKGTDGKALS